MALEVAPGSYPVAKSRGIQALLPQFKSRLCCVTFCGYVSLCASGASLQVGTVAALTSGVCEGDSEVRLQSVQQCLAAQKRVWAATVPRPSTRLRLNLSSHRPGHARLPCLSVCLSVSQDKG